MFKKRDIFVFVLFPAGVYAQMALNFIANYCCEEPTLSSYGISEEGQRFEHLSL